LKYLIILTKGREGMKRAKG